MLYAERIAYADMSFFQKLQGWFAYGVGIDFLHATKNHQCSSSFAYDLVCQLRMKQHIRLIAKQIVQVGNASFPVALHLALTAYNERAFFLVKYFYQMFH